MANRMKEDEKNERVIRNLLKLPENRRCINCNSLGPQYVCTNFSTFVCTTCGGIHREFTHRVKSVSMAKFTPQEVSALQGGGNASAREIYLKEWDPQRNSLPDGSNVERLRDFIRHVYVDRRYTGERNMEKPLKMKMAETEDFNSNRRTDTYQGGLRSPHNDSFERRHSDRPSPGGRSPGYDEENRQNSTYRSPNRTEVVNDWRREDRFGNGRRSEGRSSDGGSKFEGGSPDSQSPPVVRPVRDILGENVSPLRVIEPPKPAVGGKSTDGSHTQRTASSSSMASSDVNPAEIKVEASFIDFDSVPEPPITAPVNKQVPVATSSVQQTASSGNDWANFDSAPQVKAYAAASNSVESVLSELSITTHTPGHAALGSNSSSSGAPPGGAAMVSSGQPPQQILHTEGYTLQNTNAPTTTGPWSALSPQQVVTPIIGGSLTSTAWNTHAPNAHRPQVDTSSVAKVGQTENTFSMGTSIGVSTESSSDAKSGGRKALPEDLFTMNYPYRQPVPGWYSGSPYVAWYPMRQDISMPIPSSQPVPRSMNPFDVGHAPSSVQQSAFPLMVPLQGVMPRPATASAQMPSYPAAVQQSPFMGQEMAHGVTPRPQGSYGFSMADQSMFTPQNPNAQLSGFHPAPSTSSSFTSATGNPFG
ncbi:uncharacterized protein LOC127239790 [Andrographis paniculata]|uniref:uncharacterized protein LOC127239790 n=1 Tax=Andrographis paniculata TaxID=175694 RepID=UPI0021E788DF|nr:uncharacterized protein LOC127239790 [Andrographis paniculata]